MGQARQRASAYDRAKADLLGTVDGETKIVAETAIALFENFVLPRRFTGGCYLTTMVLHRYLMLELGVTTVPVVGYINDGTDDIFMSHAWIEFEGRKIDLTAHLTEYPEVQLSGALLVLDRVLRPGRVLHSYHAAMTPEAEAQNDMMAQDDRQVAALIAHKAREHREMSERAADANLMAKYLAGAPAEQGYEAMRAAIVSARG